MTDATPKSCRILAVDDEEIVQSLVRDALEDEGHQVFTAADGHEALQILHSNQIDLLITDIRMPNMSGTDLAEQARALNPAIGIIFMTGYASLTSAKDAIKRGALDYIMKPFELAEIRLAVRNGIGKLTTAAASQEQLTSLSDFSNMLFAAGDRRSLITSSLRFAMMNLKCKSGSVLYYDRDRGEYVMFTDWTGESREDVIGREPLHSMAEDGLLLQMHDPILVTSLEDHPVYQKKPDPALRPFLVPPWMTEQDQVIIVPVLRAATFHGLMVFAHNEDTVRIKQTDLKFLSITASQLAISLENLLLLEEAQRAYGRLKELQDETIELEKMATRGVMSAEIGHELNNFLGVVIGNVEMLQHHLNEGHVDRLGKYVDNVTTTLAKIRSFTENLMDLRSISSNEEIISIDRLLGEVVEYLRPQKRFREVQILMPEEMASISFKADATQIQQLLYNLFHNAADATANCARREIRVGLERSQNADTFRLTVEDTGVGFDPESLTKAFQEQFTTKESGHGFGLMVCRRIIDKHGGKLDIESAPGKGTRLSITFPVATEAAASVPVC
jgi:signal transduction histidine kinase/FixJ family two-component response regulator